MSLAVNTDTLSGTEHTNESEQCALHDEIFLSTELYVEGLAVVAHDARGREALVRYALRPPIAQERLHILPDDLVRIELIRPFSDGDAEEWLKNQTVAILTFPVP